VSATGTVTWLAVRELWISFRLLTLLAAYVGVGALVALIPAPSPITLARLAVGLAVAVIVGAGIAAVALSTERRLGRAGWLVTRSIARGTVVMGWFAALAGISLAGLSAAAVLGWVAASPIQPTPFLAIFAGVAATAFAALAIGLLIGALLDPIPAIFSVVAVCLLAAAAAFYLLPTAAVPLAALAELDRLERPVAAGVQGAGIGLAITAAALVLARVALGRADL
jgi:hypothetical protein